MTDNMLIEDEEPRLDIEIDPEEPGTARSCRLRAWASEQKEAHRTKYRDEDSVGTS